MEPEIMPPGLVTGRVVDGVQRRRRHVAAGRGREQQRAGAALDVQDHVLVDQRRQVGRNVHVPLARHAGPP